jgi:cell division protease FtsH
MSRFFKSAAFPILIVVVLAFFAQKLISTGDEKAPPSYGAFIQQLQRPNVIKSVDLKTKDNSISVTQVDGKKYEYVIKDVSYVPDLCGTSYLLRS